MLFYLSEDVFKDVLIFNAYFYEQVLFEIFVAKGDTA